MRKKYIKPEIEITKCKVPDIMAISGGMVEGTVSGVAAFTAQSGMAGGTIGGSTTFTPQY